MPSAEYRLPVHRQRLTGILLALAIGSAWIVTHSLAVLHYTWSHWSLFTAPVLAAFICWLYVGLFIVAHDCMHGTLAPGWPQLNRFVGRLCVTLYAGFDYDALNASHHRHHRHAGTADDPDFEPTPPHGFWPWYIGFLRRYASWRQPAFFTLLIGFYVALLGASALNVAVFLVVPAIASSLQLFYFGTYLPHRPGSDPFMDAHKTRTSSQGWLLSLLSCFHFGYHHEHHAYVDAPWWRLPHVRRWLRTGKPV
jgi:beta-carotene ketolase (CrtW type)